MGQEIISHANIAGWRRYAFKCPSCGEEGNIGLDPKTSGQFGCPAECGASFIEYQLPDQRWAIRCVVQPVFEHEPEPGSCRCGAAPINAAGRCATCEDELAADTAE